MMEVDGGGCEGYTEEKSSQDSVQVVVLDALSLEGVSSHLKTNVEWEPPLILMYGEKE